MKIQDCHPQRCVHGRWKVQHPCFRQARSTAAHAILTPGKELVLLCLILLSCPLVVLILRFELSQQFLVLL